MDVKKKLVELIVKAKEMYADDYTDRTEEEYIAETLLDNFITVRDGKPIEAFLHPIDAYKGLKVKYLVFKADTGEMVDNCFILRPDKDAVAVEALRAYAKVTDNETLAKDIYNWVGNGVTVQGAADNDVAYKLKATDTVKPNDDVRAHRVKLDINNLFQQIDDLLSKIEEEDLEKTVFGVGVGLELLISYLRLIAIRAIELDDDVLIGMLLDLHVLKKEG